MTEHTHVLDTAIWRINSSRLLKINHWKVMIGILYRAQLSRELRHYGSGPPDSTWEASDSFLPAIWNSLYIHNFSFADNRINWVKLEAETLFLLDALGVFSYQITWAPRNHTMAWFVLADYTETAEISPMDGGGIRYEIFPFGTYCCLLQPLWCLPRALVASWVYHY
jgi:hypothetical protein